MPGRARRVVAGYRAAAWLCQRLPSRGARALSAAAGLAAYALAGDGKRIARRNMGRVLGPGLSGREARRLVRGVFTSYARYYVDSFRLPALTAGDVERGFTVDGYENLVAGAARGVGPILALPHLGGWEWAGFWLTACRGHRVTAVAEALRPAELFEWFTALRAKLGMDIVALGPGAGAGVIAAIKEGHVTCLLCDRDLSGGGVEVEFFGEKTTLPAGPATMALRTGAALLPTAVYFRGGKVHGLVRPPIPTERQGRLRDDVERITQLLAYELERLIALAPEQWHLLQPNWPSDYAALGRARRQDRAPCA